MPCKVGICWSARTRAVVIAAGFRASDALRDTSLNRFASDFVMSLRGVCLASLSLPFSDLAGVLKPQEEAHAHLVAVQRNSGGPAFGMICCTSSLIVPSHSEKHACSSPVSFQQVCHGLSCSCGLRSQSFRLQTALDPFFPATP